MTLTRLLQTSLDGALDAGDPSGEGEAFCLRSCPCAVVPGSDPTKVLQDKKKADAGKIDSTDVTCHVGEKGVGELGNGSYSPSLTFPAAALTFPVPTKTLL